uniref:Matrix metalloproteinase n=1 Tax=Enchytraeus japonensis TaxID=228735 RepID=A0AAT9FG57_9ANNE
MFWCQVMALLGSCVMTHPLEKSYGYDLSGGNNDGGSIKKYQKEFELRHMDGTTYLSRYGYLPGSDLETGALRTEDELIRAVTLFQRHAHIPQTGRLDDATVKMMKEPRCGVIDAIHDHRNSAHNQNRHSGRGRRGAETLGGLKPIITLSRETREALEEPQQYVLGPSSWKKKYLTFRILNYTPDLSYEETRDAIIRAFYLWSDVTPLSFHEIQSGDADIYIQFSSGYHQDGYTFDGPGMVLAHAFFPGEGRGGDIHFDEDERWTVRTKEGVNLYAVMAHELGHSLGLAHSYVQGSLMFPWHRGYDPDLKLHQDDIQAIQLLYGVREKAPPPPVTPHPKLPTAPPTSTTTKPTTTTRAIRRFTINLNPVTMAPVTRAFVPIEPVTKATVPKVPPTKEKANTDPDRAPDKCSVTLDAISLIRGEVFAFSGKWFWRLSADGVMAGYPIQISRFWFGLPRDLTRVDAVVERPNNGHILFFSGARYFEFYGNSLLPGYSPNGRPISELGLPSDLDGVDAAFVWAHNRRIYIIKDTMYWRLDDGGRSVDHGYPRDMSMWGGVPLPVSAAFTHTDRHTYFFHGRDYYEFNNIRMRVKPGYPKPMTSRWLGCDVTDDSPSVSRRDSLLMTNMADTTRASLFVFIIVGLNLLTVFRISKIL